MRMWLVPAKVLVDFAKKFKQLEIKSGQVSGRAIDAEAIRSWRNYRAKIVLLAQALSAMQGVPSAFGQGFEWRYFTAVECVKSH